MTEPVLSVDLDASPSEALRLLAGYPVHHLPVVEDGRLVGILSDADLKKLDAFLPQKGEATDAYLDSCITIARMMSRPVVTAGPDEPLAQVAARMVSAGVHAVPVVGPLGHLVGILTTTDIINGALQVAPGVAGQAPLATDAATRSIEVQSALHTVLHVADRYLRGGQDEALHALLLNAVEHAKALRGEPTGARSAMRSL